MNPTIKYSSLENTYGKDAVTNCDDGFDSLSLKIAESPILNNDFIQSRAGRTIRIMSEFEEFPKRMEQYGIRGTFLFFGSARTVYKKDYNDRMGGLLEKKAHAAETEVASVTSRIEALERLEWAAKWMEKTERLAYLLTEWSLTDEGREAGMWCKSKLLKSPSQSQPSLYGCCGPRLGTLSSVVPSDNKQTLEYAFEQPLVVCTGGGPGFMEAGNKGAYSAKGLSMGVSVSLQFETELNRYVTPGLHFRMNYFFSRKFWEVLCAKAVICCPGGMGTLEEMFEVLTLIQCGKCPTMPIVLLGKEFWEEIINWRKLAGYGLITHKEVDNLCFTDEPQEAFEFIVNAVKKEANDERSKIKNSK
eukprot:Tbor_TRINITY_DN5418_c0_g1::TRINITY_DN5418_c0_g1_i3::g.24734::m.24734/K06966/K06966; uncharacterized protein